MVDEQADLVFEKLVRDHRRATERIIWLNNSGIGRYCTTSVTLLAIEDEVRARNQLIDWHAPTARLALEKLCHLFIHVIAAKLVFDDRSLARIREEVALYRTSPSQPVE